MAGLLAFFTTLNPKVANPARAPDNGGNIFNGSNDD